MANKYIWVQATGNFTDGGRIVLWERDEAHPNGEIFIGSDKPVQVGETAAVAERVRTGALKKVEAPVATKSEAPVADDESDDGDEGDSGKKAPKLGRPKANS